MNQEACLKRPAVEMAFPMLRGRVHGAIPGVSIMRGWLVCLLLLGLLGVAPNAWAQAAQDCTVSATPVAFGVYDPVESTTPLDGVGQITVDCRGNFVFFQVSLSAGGSGSYAAREMTSGPNTLQYNLYLDAARTIIFGDGSGGSQNNWCVTGFTFNRCVGSNPPGPTRRAVLPFYGRVPAGQDPAVGFYSDVVQVEIVF